MAAEGSSTTGAGEELDVGGPNDYNEERIADLEAVVQRQLCFDSCLEFLCIRTNSSYVEQTCFAGLETSLRSAVLVLDVLTGNILQSGQYCDEQDLIDSTKYVLGLPGGRVPWKEGQASVALHCD